MRGSPSRAMGPGTVWSTGTSRTAITLTACSAQTPSRTASRASPCPLSLGRNTSPVPYLPASGTGIPRDEMKPWGICTSIPAPSPLLPSPFSAPLWAMPSMRRSPFSTTEWDLLPPMSTTRPTPQLSRASSGSYSPP